MIHKLPGGFEGVAGYLTDQGAGPIVRRESTGAEVGSEWD